ncbi:unnamed protein product [Amoebophrya sp. A120]|nr:unnamed protein product [Amoebophrya sp. A120]|eukprot:GSA120T00016748001.1
MPTPDFLADIEPLRHMMLGLAHTPPPHSMNHDFGHVQDPLLCAHDLGQSCSSTAFAAIGAREQSELPGGSTQLAAPTVLSASSPVSLSGIHKAGDFNIISGMTENHTTRTQVPSSFLEVPEPDGTLLPAWKMFPAKTAAAVGPFVPAATTVTAAEKTAIPLLLASSFLVSAGSSCISSSSGRTGARLLAPENYYAASVSSGSASEQEDLVHEVFRDQNGCSKNACSVQSPCRGQGKTTPTTRWTSFATSSPHDAPGAVPNELSTPGTTQVPGVPSAADTHQSERCCVGSTRNHYKPCPRGFEEAGEARCRPQVGVYEGPCQEVQDFHGFNSAMYRAWEERCEARFL